MDPDGVWQVVPPPRPSRIPGVAMAGFRDRGAVDHALLPHPDVTVVLDFGPSAPIVDDLTGRHRGSLVAPLGYGRAASVRGRDIACVQVRLSPVVARAVLGHPVADVVRLDELWGRDASRLGERLAGAGTWSQRFELIDAVLARRLAGAPQPEPELAWAWRRLVASRGRVRVEHVAGELGWSRKRLWSRFGAQLGTPPKRAASLLRFDHAVHRLAAGTDAATAAVETGYVDQSHLHRDVVAHAGVTPAAVAAEPFLAVDDVAWPTSISRTV